MVERGGEWAEGDVGGWCVRSADALVRRSGVSGCFGLLLVPRIQIPCLNC